MHLRSSFVALTAAILNSGRLDEVVIPDVSICSVLHDECPGNALNEDLSSSVTSEHLFDMELKPTLKLITKHIDSQPMLQSYDVLMDMIDEQLDEEELDLDEDDISSIDSPITPDSTGTGAFLLNAFHPFSDEDSSPASILSQLPDNAEDTINVETTPANYLQGESDGLALCSSEPAVDHRTFEVEMVKKYVWDLEHGKTWDGTARQGLRPRQDRRQHILDDAPSKRPDESPLLLLLTENRFAAAVNRAYKASGSTYQPYPVYRFPLERDPDVSFGVHRSESGSLYQIRVDHARAYRSALLPFHSSY